MAKLESANIYVWKIDKLVVTAISGWGLKHLDNSLSGEGFPFSPLWIPIAPV